MKTIIKDRFCILEFNTAHTRTLSRSFADTFHKAMKRIRVLSKQAVTSRFDLYDHSIRALVVRI